MKLTTKERYHRIPAASTTSSTSLSLDPRQHGLDADDEQDNNEHPYNNDPLSTLNNNSNHSNIDIVSNTSSHGATLRRPGRRSSRGSYSSILSGNGLLSDDDEELVDQQQRHIDGFESYLLSGEKSPLRNTSFDEDDDDHESGRLPPAATTSSPPSRHNSRAASPISGGPQIYKFALEDDDDDDFEDEDYDVHLKRYAAATAANTNNGGASMMTSLHGVSSSSSSSSNSRLIFYMQGLTSYLWFQFQTVRQQARQRRAQLLLQQSERHWHQSLWICCVTTLCDATDGGIALVATGLLVWILLLMTCPDKHKRREIFGYGLVLWVVRFGFRPFRQYWIKHLRHRCFFWRNYHGRQRQSVPTDSPSRSSTNRTNRTRPVPLSGNHHAPFEDHDYGFAKAPSTTSVMELSSSNGVVNNNNDSRHGVSNGVGSPPSPSSPVNTDPTIHII